MRQFVIIIQKTKEPCVENDFSKFKVTKKLFRTKCIDFSQEESQSHEQWMNFLENESTTAIRLFEEFPYIKKKYLWGGKFWNRSSFVASVGNVSLETVKKYIENQGK